MPANKMPPDFEKYADLPDHEVASILGVSRKTVNRWRQRTGIKRDRTKISFPDNVRDMAKNMGLNELCRALGWKSLQIFSPRLLSHDPIAHAMAKANSRKASVANLTEKNDDDFDLEKAKRQHRITRAVHHLQRQRLGPCYPWKTGYYWMGKCLDADALMAEARKRGWGE